MEKSGGAFSGGQGSIRAANPGLRFRNAKDPSRAVCVLGMEKSGGACSGGRGSIPSRVNFGGKAGLRLGGSRALPMRALPIARPPNPKQMETMFPDRANLRHAPRAPLGQDCSERNAICLHTAVGFACAYPNGFPASGAGVRDVVL